jgi:hypothetical protein
LDGGGLTGGLEAGGIVTRLFGSGRIVRSAWEPGCDEMGGMVDPGLTTSDAGTRAGLHVTALARGSPDEGGGREAGAVGGACFVAKAGEPDDTGGLDRAVSGGLFEVRCVDGPRPKSGDAMGGPLVEVKPKHRVTASV